MKRFKPDGLTNFTDDTGKVKRQIPSESISQCGGVIVVTAYLRNDSKRGEGYGLTHTTTGGTLTGNRLTADIDGLKKKARRFWRALTAEQKKVWKTSASVASIAAATPRSVQQILK